MHCTVVLGTSISCSACSFMEYCGKFLNFSINLESKIVLVLNVLFEKHYCMYSRFLVVTLVNGPN